MANATVITIAVLFTFMGIAALAAPQRILAQFGIPRLTADGRNEVRAVYGGFGVFVAALLAATLEFPVIRVGALAAVAAALAGMAAGRLLSAALDGAFGRWPRFYCVVELLLSGALAAAI